MPTRPPAGAPTILGIDPGLAATGWALLREGAVVASGTIRTAPGAAPARLLHIQREIENITALHSVAEAAVEELFMGVNRTSALAVAQARGVVLAALAAAGVRIFEYKPAQVKLVLTGYGNADKVQMQRMALAQLTFREPADSDHSIDAAAIAVCHQRSRQLNISATRQAARLRPSGLQSTGPKATA